MSMETAIKGKRTRVSELYGHRSPIGRQKYIDTPRTRGVEGVVAYDGMVIGIVVDPLHSLTRPNRNGKRCKAILIRYDDLTNSWIRTLSHSTVKTTQGKQADDKQPKRRPPKT